VSPVDLPDPGTFAALPVSFQANTYQEYTSHTNRAAVFAEDRLRLNAQTSVVSGVRLDRYSVERLEFATQTTSARTFNPVSWRVGSVYNVTPTSALYAQYSTAVEAVGNLVSLSAAQQKFNLTHGNQVEVGAKASFLNRGEATFAAYRIVKNDLLQPDPINRSSRCKWASSPRAALRAPWRLPSRRP
jgi:iron complex outermembrane receptor protein